ncbi:MAG: hypothetical protein MZV63_14690 [Marinilabiliales bacterium]|nr:hypothetical protein [Marinilabiliales bacterium]
MTLGGSKSGEKRFYKAVAEGISDIEKKTSNISTHRQKLLEGLAFTISERLKTTGKAELIFICTHNSRRSHPCTGMGSGGCNVV